MKKVRKVVGVAMLLAFGFQYASAGWCLQKPLGNKGYCAEELGGRGVCVKYRPNSSATRCMADQPQFQ